MWAMSVEDCSNRRGRVLADREENEVEEQAWSRQQWEKIHTYLLWAEAP